MQKSIKFIFLFAFELLALVAPLHLAKANNCPAILANLKDKKISGRAYEIRMVGDDPAGSGGRFFSSHLNFPEDSHPELPTFIKVFPHFTSRFDLFIRENGDLVYGDPLALNHRIDKVADSDHAVHVRFYADSGKTDFMSYALRWANEGAVPIAEPKPGDDLDLHIHDLRSHGPGFLLLPKKITERHRGHVKFLLSLYKDSLLSKNLGFKAYVKNLIGTKTGDLDLATANIGLALLNAGVNSPENSNFKEKFAKGLRSAIEPLIQTRPESYAYPEAFPFDHWSAITLKSLADNLISVPQSVEKVRKGPASPYILSTSEKQRIRVLLSAVPETPVILSDSVAEMIRVLQSP